MPCLEITMPATSKSIREELVQRLTTAFVTATSFEKDIFSICFLEYQEGQAAVGGRLCHGNDDRPLLHLNLNCPRLTRSKKQLLVRLLTEAFVVAVQQRHWEPVIHINEHPYDNVGVGGQLLSDAYPECAARKFYYELSEA